MIFIRPFGPGENLPAEERRRRKGLSQAEVEAIAERARRCKAVAPLELIAVEPDQVRATRSVQNAQVLGTTPAYETVHDTFVERGRFLIRRRRRARRARWR